MIKKLIILILTILIFINITSFSNANLNDTNNKSTKITQTNKVSEWFGYHDDPDFLKIGDCYEYLYGTSFEGAILLTNEELKDYDGCYIDEIAFYSCMAEEHQVIVKIYEEKIIDGLYSYILVRSHTFWTLGGPRDWHFSGDLGAGVYRIDKSKVIIVSLEVYSRSDEGPMLAYDHSLAVDNKGNLLSKNSGRDWTTLKDEESIDHNWMISIHINCEYTPDVEIEIIGGLFDPSILIPHVEVGISFHDDSLIKNNDLNDLFYNIEWRFEFDNMFFCFGDNEGRIDQIHPGDNITINSGIPIGLSINGDLVFELSISNVDTIIEIRKILLAGLLLYVY